MKGTRVFCAGPPEHTLGGEQAVYRQDTDNPQTAPVGYRLVQVSQVRSVHGVADHGHSDPGIPRACLAVFITGPFRVSQWATSFCAAKKALLSATDTSVGTKAISVISVSTFSRDRG